MPTRHECMHVAQSQHKRRSSNSLAVLAVASLVAGVCLMLMSCSGAATTTDPQAAQQAHARASLTAGVRVTQTAFVAASQTAAAIPLIPLPYTAAAPGPGCDMGGATWTAQTPQGASCLTNPARLRLTAVTDASANTSQNEVDWVFGLSGKLPSTYRVSVQVSGLLDRTSAGEVGAMLVVYLGAPIDIVHSYNIGFSADGATANYGVWLDGIETGIVSYDVANLTKTTTITIEVSTTGVSALLNGVTKLKKDAAPQTGPQAVTGISLQMRGPAGDHVDFANLSIEQV